MARAIRCVVAFAIAWSLQAGVSFAEADWLDRASGPGPFKGLFVQYRFLCVARTPKTVEGNTTEEVSFHPLGPWERTASPLNALFAPLDKEKTKVSMDITDGRLACKSDNRYVRGYFEVVYRRAVSVANDLVERSPQVHMISFEVAYVDRLSRAWDFRLGVAKNLIDPHRRDWFWADFDADKAHDAFTPFTRYSATPSLIWYPIATAGDSRWGHFIQVQGGATIFLGGFHAQDFCNTGVARCLDPTWQTHGADIIPMTRVLIDVAQLWPWH